MELQAHVTCTHESACAIGILECSITLFRKSKHHVGVGREDTQCYQAWHEPQTCTHMYHDSCRVASIMWQCVWDPWHCWWHMSSHVSCGTYCDPGAPWLIRHCADIIPRQLQVIAIWRSRDFKIVKSWDHEIYRLQDLEIATSEIVKGVDCEYCGVWHMRVSQSLSRRIWAMTKCRLDLSESLNNVLTEIKSDKRTCKKEWRQNMMSWSQVTQTCPTKHLQSRKWVDT